MSEEYNYISFPLPLIRKFFLEPSQAAFDILDYGVYRTASGMNIDLESAYKQLTYNFIHQDEKEIPAKLMRKLKAFTKQGYLSHLDYNGFEFSDDNEIKSFDVQDDISLLQQLADDDPLFASEVQEWYRLRQVQDVIDYPFDADMHEDIKANYQRMEKAFNGQKQLPVSCKTEFLLQKVKNCGTERERAKFCFYLGIRSLIGKKDLAFTNSEAIYWRMFGCRNDVELGEVLKDKRLAAIYGKWHTRRQYTNFLDELRLEGLVNKVTRCRETIVTCSLQDDAEFCEAIIRHDNEHRISAARQQLREREKAMRERLKALSGNNDDSLNIPFADVMDG